ncbi:Chitobiase/beta-hexosaminidase C-terminal domain-containing protein [Granulicella rosea]|uniref:Chitobiase/beta-hexosaminidase C-terminal domain-containing protein n=1 Tax=Granulicella rosea TaxID=474952 RepID=A0A239ECQ8_9BACT|nr:chitobiase/beta-hexosaminidase C-terminal domain-containing protein [Granulicella rosea]SNS41724.1 Chitobiase/beta-hexosaminidase C-terminal domain-containing protein [Granulicella rosea]
MKNLNDFRLIKPLVATVLFTALGLFTLSGCGISGSSTSSVVSAPTPGPLSVGTMSGTVHGGQFPVYNATVNLYAAGTTGYGNGSTLLATTITNASGKFQFTKLANGSTNSGASWSCPASDPNPDPQIYITAVGGNTQGTGVTTTNNTAAALIAAIGPCSSLNSSTPVSLNEVTTVATVFALAQYMNPGTSPGTEAIGTSGANTSSSTPLGALGLKNAIAGISNLASISTGSAVASNSYTGANANTTKVTVTATPETAKLITIANILAACINTPSSSSTQCRDLFDNAPPPPAASVTSQPSASFGAAQDTIQAAYYMAVNPTNAVAPATYASPGCGTSSATTTIGCLFGLPTPSAPFQTGLTAQPTDWTIGVSYGTTSTSTCASGGKFILAPFRSAVDAYGNVWSVGGYASSLNVSALSSIGVPLFCAPLASGASPYFNGITIDTAGNIWVSNDSTGTSGEIYEIPAPGAVPAATTMNSFTSGQLGSGSAAPLGIVADGYGNVFYAAVNSTGASVYEIPSGTTSSSTMASYQVGAATNTITTSSIPVFSVAADSVGRVYFVTSSNAGETVEATPPSAGISGYSVSGSTITFTTTNSPAFTVGQSVLISGLESPAGLLMDRKQLTVTAVSSSGFSASTTVAATSGVTDEGIAVVVPSGPASYSTIVNEFTTSLYGAAIDNNNSLYASTFYGSSSPPFDELLQATISPAGVALGNGNTGTLYNFSSSFLGGNNGAKAVALDGADNVWFSNGVPSRGTNKYTGTWSVGEAYTSDGGSVAAFTALSPSGSAPSTCNSTVGCPGGGGFQKADLGGFAMDIKIDSSGNVWVMNTGIVGGNPGGGTSITEIVGAAVPTVAPLSVAAANGTLATEPISTAPTLPQAATPVITVGGSSTSASVTISDTTPGATIYYTTTGAIPTTSSSIYNPAGSPIAVTSTTVVNAIAAESGYSTSALASATVNIPTASDVASVPGQVTYPEEFPNFANYSSLADPGVINVVTQGIYADGLHGDQACAIQALLNSTSLYVGQNVDPIPNENAAPWQDPIFYFPTGTYLLSDAGCLPLTKNFSDNTPADGMVLLGENQGDVIFQVAQGTLPAIKFTGNVTRSSNTITGVNTTGLGLRVNQQVKLYSGTALGAYLGPDTTIAAIKPSTSGSNGTITLAGNASTTISNASFVALTPIVRTQSTLTSSNGVNVQNGNEAYHNTIENMTFNLTGNPGSIGISYLANNFGAVRNVTVNGDTAGSFGVGIDMTRQEIGPALIENVLISGFNRGMDVANTGVGITVEHVTLQNQIGSAIFNTDNLITASSISIPSGQAGAVAVTNATTTTTAGATGDGYVVLANSSIGNTGFGSTGSALIANTGGAVSIVNTSFASSQTNLGSLSGVVSGTLVSNSAQPWTVGKNFMLPLLYDTPTPAYDTDTVHQWQSVSGMTGVWINPQNTEQVFTQSGAVATSTVDATASINAAIAAAHAYCNTGTSTLYFPHGVYYIDSTIKIPSYIDRIVGMDSTIRVMNVSTFSSGGPIFEVLSTILPTDSPCEYSANTLTIERISPDNYGAPSVGSVVQADAPPMGASPETVVLRDVNGHFQVLNQQWNAGEVYLENSGNPITINGPNWVMSRQYNTEGGVGFPPFITNQGAPLWILGYKTEGTALLLNSTNTTPPFATNEIIGGFFYPSTPSRPPTVPGTTCTEEPSILKSSTTATSPTFLLAPGARLEASFIEEVTPSNGKTVETSSYPFYFALDNNGTGTNCVAGAGNTTNSSYPPYPAISRTATYANTESGFIVTKLSEGP